jgi:hypothetical protein
MKIGYPDTINNKAYQGEKSPFKMVDKSKADLDKDGKVSDYEENRAEAAFGSEAPLNYSPLQAREMSAKRRARRGKRVEKIEAKANSIAEQKYLEDVAEEDLPTTAKKGKVRKYNRLTKKADRISDKTTKILRDNNQVPSARKKKSPGDAKSDFARPKKSSRLSKRVDRLDKKLEKSGVKKTKDGNYTGDSRREIRLRKQDRKAGAAAGYGNMDEAKSTAKLDKTLAKKGYKRKEIKSPIKAVSPARAKLIAANKTAAEKAKKAEDALRKSSSEPTTTATKKKSLLAKRKERRAEKNPKVRERQEGKAIRKADKKNNKLAIKTQKSLVTKARQDKRIAKARAKQAGRLVKVTKKVGEKVSDVNEGTGLGISKNNPIVGNVVKDIVRNKKSPAKFASAAQRKAVWASKNEKKKK